MYYHPLGPKPVSFALKYVMFIHFFDILYIVVDLWGHQIF
jgi:hypothetical protein